MNVQKFNNLFDSIKSSNMNPLTKAIYISSLFEKVDLKQYFDTEGQAYYKNYPIWCAFYLSLVRISNVFRVRHIKEHLDLKWILGNPKTLDKLYFDNVSGGRLDFFSPKNLDVIDLYGRIYGRYDVLACSSVPENKILLGTDQLNFIKYFGAMELINLK